MMNPFERKMFNSKPPRPARNKLNQMGGIMASSVPLMQGVQKFATGNMVNIGVDQLNQVLGRTGNNFTIPIDPSRRLVPYDPFRAFNASTLPMGPAPRSMGPTSQADRTISTSKSLVPLGTVNSSTPEKGILSQLLNSNIARFGKRSLLGLGAIGVVRPFVDPLDSGNVPAYDRRSEEAVDTSKRLFESDRALDLEAFDALSPEAQQESLDAGNSSRAINRGAALFGRSLGGAADVVLDIAKDAIVPGTFEERVLEQAATDAVSRNRKLTMSEFRASLKSRDPEKNTSILNDRRERERERETETERESALNKEISNDITDELVGDYGFSKEEVKAFNINKKDSEDAAPKPELSTIVDADLPVETKGQVIADEIKALMTDFETSSTRAIKEANAKVLELFNKKPPGKKLTLKESAKANIELYNEFFGVDPAEDMKEDGFNLAYLGFAIAAGDSPNALQNIANGAMTGLKKIGNTNKARKERKDRAKTFGLNLAVQQDSELKKADQKRWEMMFNLQSKGIEAVAANQTDVAKFGLTTKLNLAQEIRDEERKKREDERMIEARKEAALVKAEVDRNLAEAEQGSRSRPSMSEVDSRRSFVKFALETDQKTVENGSVAEDGLYIDPDTNKFTKMGRDRYALWSSLAGASSGAPAGAPTKTIPYIDPNQ